jgi:outer membrane biogenesis lipoprotein LolB
MRYRITVIAVLTGLLVTGCSSESSSSPADNAQLAQYQTCLASEAQAYDDLINQRGFGKFKPDRKSFYSTTEWAMMLCAQYQPQ